MSSVPLVYNALQQVKDYANASFIAKEREVKDGVRFFFRGVDDVINFFSRPLTDACLLVLPSYSAIEVVERHTKSGTANFNTKVACSIRFACSKDGSSVDVGPFYGEANDTGDKSTAKAMSIAFRQAFLFTFVVPLGPEADPEADTEQARFAYEAGEADAARANDRDAAPGPQSKAEQAAKPVEGMLAGDKLSDSMKKMLGAKLRNKHMHIDTLVQGFGVVDTANLNDALAWIKGYQADA